MKRVFGFISFERWSVAFERFVLGQKCADQVNDHNFRKKFLPRLVLYINISFWSDCSLQLGQNEYESIFENVGNGFEESFKSWLLNFPGNGQKQIIFSTHLYLLKSVHKDVQKPFAENASNFPNIKFRFTVLIHHYFQFFRLQCDSAKRCKIVVRRNQCKHGKNTGNFEDYSGTVRTMANVRWEEGNTGAIK